MNIFEKMSNLFRKKSVGFIASSVNNTSYLDTPEEALSKIAYVFRAVVIITSKLASIPFTISNPNTKTENKRLIAKFKHGNPLFSWFEIVTMTQAQNELRGFTVWDLSNGYIDVLESDLISFVQQNGEIELQYTNPLTGQMRALDRSKIAIFRNFTLRPRLTGLPTLTAAMGGAQMVAESQAITVNLMRNGAILPVYIKLTQPLSSTQVEQLKTAWKKRFAGADNAGHTPVMPPGVTVEKLGLTPTDLSVLQNIEKGEAQIATAFGVPSLFLNDLKNTKYDSAESQERVFTRYTIQPKAKMFADTVNKQVLPIFNDLSDEFSFDFSRLPELQGDSLKQEQVFDIRIKNGTMTINERRALEGKEPVPWGDAWWGPLNFTELGTEKSKSKIYVIEKKVDKTDLIWKNFVARTTPQENKLAKELLKFFKKQEKFVLESLGLKAFEFPKSWDEALAKLLKTYLLAFMQQAGDTQAVEFGITFDLQRPEIQRWLAAKVMTSAVQVNTTTKKDILKQLQEAEANGESVREMSGRIKNLFEETYKNRAQTIARTEVISANNKAGIEAAKQAGMKFKVWVTALDERTRPWHAEANGQKVPINDTFIVHGEALQFPGDPSASPDNIINCRCTMTYE